MAEDTASPPAHGGTVNVPGMGKVKSKTAVMVGGGAVVLLLIYFYMKQRSAAQAAIGTTTGTTTGAMTDPAGNTCDASQINPQTGFCSGSTQDQTALASILGYNSTGVGTAFTGGGGTGVTTTGLFGNNASWAQAVYTALGSNGTDSIAQAVSAYLAGAVVTANEMSMIDEAIAIEGLPPVAGTGGMPPAINSGTGTGSGVGTTTNPTNVVVPNCAGMSAGSAHNAIVSAGLVPTDNSGTVKGEASWTVASTTPAGGTSVAQGSRVMINATKPAPTPAPAPKPGGKYTVKSGDTLSGIAAKLNYPGGWQALYAKNRAKVGSNPNKIRVGLVLDL